MILGEKGEEIGHFGTADGEFRDADGKFEISEVYPRGVRQNSLRCRL